MHTHRQAEVWKKERLCSLPPFLCPFHYPVGRLSEECEYFAYGLSSSGSDWVTVRFMKADDLTPLDDVLERVKFSCLAWTHDAKGVFYNCYPRQEGKTDGEHVKNCVHKHTKHQSNHNFNLNITYNYWCKCSQDLIFLYFAKRHRNNL